MKIIGLQGMSGDQLGFELSRGAKFVFFQYCVSLLVITFRRSSSLYFIRPEESAVAKGLPFSLISLVAGWWGIPWGPIFTVQTIYRNFAGGRDVTKEVVASLSTASQQQQSVAAAIPASPAPLA